MPGLYAPDFGSKHYDAGGTSVEQTNAILEEDPSDTFMRAFVRTPLATSPAHRLLVAVLETALHLVVTTRPHRRRTSQPYQEAFTWVFSDADHEFSIVYILEHLHLDQHLRPLREGVLRKLAANDHRPLLIQSRSAERKRQPRKALHDAKGPYYEHERNP